MYLNKALVIGNLTRDPEQRALPSGIAVTSFSVATNRVYKDKDGKSSYSIWNSFSGMNVDSLGPTMVKCYTYDMMSQRTNYSFPLYEMIMVDG